MEPFIVTCTIRVADAIAAGRNRAGRYDHELEDHEAIILKSKDLDAVVRPYLAARGESSGRRLPVKEPSFFGVVKALEALRESESTARRRVAAERGFIHEWGTPNQVARIDDGTLPEEELLDVARRIAFLGTRLQRYDTASRLGPKDIRHRKDCPEAGQEYQLQPIEYEKLDGAELAADQHDALESLRGFAPRAPFMAPEITLHTHVATCPGCGATAKRPTALVTISWATAGRTLSREYLLKT